MIAPEALPFSKTGGLADVSGALPRALARLGHDVTLVVPRYRETTQVARATGNIAVAAGARTFEAAVSEYDLETGARVWLIEQPDLYDREFPYGKGNDDYPDNAVRFAFLSKAALALASRSRTRFDLVHANDWQTGLVPLYLRQQFARDDAFATAATVFTIHNLAYQGLFEKDWLPELGLGWELFTPDALEFWGRISLLKAGINFSDRLTTVSPKYAREIQAPATGFGFDGIIRRRAGALTGILNGIDTEAWDPARDPHIPRPYTRDDLSGKRDAKRSLLQAFGLDVNDDSMARPLVGMVSRMVDQKGLDLISAMSGELPHLGASIVVMGAGEDRYEQMWRALATAWPDRIAATIGFDEGLSHLVEAGADLWLMPSHFEPCGLNQMYSQRYGTLPLVHATGGLDDTVENYDPANGTGTGFKFDAYEPAALLNTLRRALSVYTDRDAWRRLQVRAMGKDFSWRRAAEAYVAVYLQALAGREVAQAVTV